MNIRPLQIADLEALTDIDATIESERYLHLDRAGEGCTIAWKLDNRPLRQKLILPNPMNDEQRFMARQIAGGIDEGLALLAEHENQIVAALIAQPRPAIGTMKLIDLRVDYDFRRQGLGSALIFQLIQVARQGELRAICAETLTNNFPASQLLLKLGFDLAGIDTQRHSNHDLVKEAVTLFWYATLE